MRTRVALRQRLLQQFLLVVVLPLMVVAALGALVLLPALKDAAEQRNRRLAEALRDQVEQMLGARLRTALVVADRLRSADMSPAQVLPSLQSILSNDAFVQAAYVTDSHGVVRDIALSRRGALAPADFIGLDQSSQPHYRAARALGVPQWSETFLSIMTGRLTVVLVVPADLRTLMIELSLDELSAALKHMGKPGEVRAVVLDRSGRVIGHPRSEAARQQESLANLPLVARAIEGAQAADGRIEFDGEEYLAQMLPVVPIGWHVLVAESVNHVLAPLRGLAWVMALSLLATFVSASALAWWFARRAGQEVNLLTTAAQPAPDGAPHAAEPRFRTAEFAELWQRLNALFQEIRERELQAQAARRDLQAVLDAATEVAIVAVDLDGTVRLFSRGAAKLLGYSEAEIVGRASPQTWHDPAEVAARCAELTRMFGRPVEGMEAFLAVPRQAGYEVRDWTFVRADGTRLDVSLAVSGIRNAQGDLIGFLGVGLDITERRKAAALEVARRAAEASSAAKSEFLSRMSHELRSPLNAMLGFAQLMEMDGEEAPSPGQRTRLQQMQRAGWHLVELIDDVLDLARIESGKTRLTIAPVDMATVVERAVELVSPEIEQYQLTLDVHSAGCSARAMADETRLVQVLVNLLSNAAKYNRPHGRIELECAPADEGRLAIRVRDTGRGMSGAQLARLYEPFNRLGRESSNVAGTGIGLVIARHLVQMMDGDLQADSRAGHGTTFTVLLPRAADALRPQAVTPPLVSAAAGSGAGRARVVYIEDNLLNATLMRQILRQRPNIELQVAATAADGLELLRKAPPDLLLLDVHLPDATGPELLAMLAAEEALRGLPVIMVSADATQRQVEASLRNGARGYLTKPLNVAETLAHVDRVLAAGVRIGLAK